MLTVLRPRIYKLGSGLKLPRIENNLCLWFLVTEVIDDDPGCLRVPLPEDHP